MMMANGFFFFKFKEEKGLIDVLEGGPWMVRNSPLFLNKWTPNMNLSKEDHVQVPVWVKLPDVPIAGFTDDGLSVIASKISKPMMLDSYTSSMCVESCGRPSYARAMIEVLAQKALCEKVVVATPNLDEIGGYTKEIVTVEHEWKPPRCSTCKIFGHTNQTCPLNVSIIEPKVVTKDGEGFEEVKKRKSKGQTNANKNKTGFPMGKEQKFFYRPKANNGFEKLNEVDEDGNMKNKNKTTDVVKDNAIINVDKEDHTNQQGDSEKADQEVAQANSPKQTTDGFGIHDTLKKNVTVDETKES